MSTTTPRRSWHQRLRAYLYPGLIALNLGAIASIALGVEDPHRLALGLTSLAILVAALA